MEDKAVLRGSEIILKTLLSILGVLIVLVFASPAFAGGWIIYHDDPYKGKVVDAETSQPIDGAAVVAIWYVQQSAWPAGPIAKLLNAKEAITDKNGDFVISSMFGFNLWPGFLDGAHLIVFKPGYKSYDDRLRSHEGDIIRLLQAKTLKERMESVVYIAACGAISDGLCIPERKIPHILKLREKEWKDLGLMK